MLWTIVIIAAVAVVILGYYYNKFVILGNRIDNSLVQIDVQLNKRADLVPNLVKTVKGYVKHEKRVFDKVVQARKEMMKATELPEKAKLGNQLQTALKSIFALAENYPDLKSNANFLRLQEELSAIEDKVAYARQFYNDSVLSYNNATKVFPAVIFAKMFNAKKKDFLKIPAEKKAVPNVEFE